MSVVGARPQFVKLAPIDWALREAGIGHVIVHTGQHYDPLLSDVFFSDLRISPPDEHLGVGSGTHGVQTGRMLAAMDPVLARHRPDWALVYGDTNSTLAAALAAVKLHIPTAHLEAGLRSFNRSMPEEVNRVLTDHAADLLLAPTAAAAAHLEAEGLGGRAVVVGDVMADVLARVRDEVAGQGPSAVERSLGLTAGSYSLATIHRPSNTDDPARLDSLLTSLGRVGHPVVLLAHPRLVAACTRAGIAIARGGLVPHPPLPATGVRHDARARRHHRLRRPAEGGLPVTGARHDRARGDRVGRNGGTGVERPRGNRRRPGRGRLPAPARRHRRRPLRRRARGAPRRPPPGRARPLVGAR